MAAPTTVRVGRTQAGYRIRIEGRGTLRESPAVREFARQVLEGEPGKLVIDLTACEYLDSTFLGCLVHLHRHDESSRPPRLLVAAHPQDCKRLLAPNCLDTLFHLTEDCPDVIGEDVVLPPLESSRDDLGRHVLECHRRLAEVGGPNQAAMQGVVDQLSKELTRG
jgi:anti-anti-sigma regulatory factor